MLRCGGGGGGGSENSENSENSEDSVVSAPRRRCGDKRGVGDFMDLEQ